MCVVLYMACNYVGFCDIRPIHGALKSGFPVPSPKWFLIAREDVLLPGLAGVLGLVFSANRKSIQSTMGVLTIALAFATFSGILNFYLFQKWSKPIPPWHLSMLVFSGLGALFSGIFSFISGSNSYRITFSLMLISLICSFSSLLKSFDKYELSSQPIELSDAVLFLRDTPEDSLFAHTDSGAISFWGGRRFVNLDGLINNFEYQDYIGYDRLSEYLAEKDIDYLVVTVWEMPQNISREYEPMYTSRVNELAYYGNYEYFDFYTYSYLYNKYSDKVRLFKCSEVFRSDAFWDGASMARNVIFDIKVNISCVQ